MSIRSKNEKVKRKYLELLREAEGLQQTTIIGVERAISLYEDYTNHSDYATFNQKKAVGFKNWLQERCSAGKTVSIATVYNHIRCVRAFFKWLAGQPGYKSRIHYDTVRYLSLDRKKIREATAPRLIRIPSLLYVLQLTESIESDTEIGQRDRALVSFLVISAMRDKAIATLPLGCFDRHSLAVHQDPRRGVGTKFGKSIETQLFGFDRTLIKNVREWAEYLEKDKLFSPEDPVFPRTVVEQVDGGLTYAAVGIEPVFWKSTNSIRSILKERSAAAGLEYYHPHTFRHLAVHLAFKRITTAEQMKAVSQNLGHEHINTTATTYGTLDSLRVKEVIKQMDFSTDSGRMASEKEIDDMIKTLYRMKKKK